MKVVLADHGAGNLHSLCSALARAGAEPEVSADPTVVREAPLVVIAGVGQLERAARGLVPLAGVLRERAESSRPVLGICVGLQLLFEQSDEGGSGLGLLRGPVRRLQAPRVPHMGWNALALARPAELLDGLDGVDVYFAHSFAVEPVAAVAVAHVEHGGTIVAAVEAGPLAGVQFHPERSGADGLRLLANFVGLVRAGMTARAGVAGTTA